MPVRTRAALLFILFVPAMQAVCATPPPASPTPVDRALQPLLAGEFALQAGRLKEAAEAYFDAARATGDPQLAGRATRIALLAKDDARAASALALWKRTADADARGSLLAAEAALALHRRDARAASTHLDALLAMPGDEGWRQALTVLGTDSRDPAQAADILDGLVARGRIPSVLQAWLAFGGLAQQLERPALAERIVDEVVRRFPGDPRAELLRASQLRESGRRDDARAALVAIESRVAGDDLLRRAVADEYFRLREFQRAEALLATGPQDERTLAQRASLLAQADDLAGLGRIYDTLRRNAAEPDPSARLLLGQIAEFLKRNDEALAWYRGVPGGPQRGQARLRSATVLHKLDRKPEAFRTLADIQSDASADEEVRRDAYLVEAALHQDDGALDREMDAFARGLAAYPDEPEVLYARALAWERRDDIPRAEADLRRVLAIDPDSTAALNALGYTLADRTTRFEEALELINRARAAEPESGAIVDSYGWVLYRLGRIDEALVELRRALTLQKDAEIAAHLAEVLWVKGERAEALRYFEQARTLDPDDRALERALKLTGAVLPPADAAAGAAPAATAPATTKTP